MVLSLLHGHWLECVGKGEQQAQTLDIYWFCFFNCSIGDASEDHINNGGWFSEVEVEEVSRGYDNDQTNESLVKLWWDNFGRGMKQHSMQCACSTCSKNLTSMYWIVFYYLDIVEIIFVTSCLF